MADCMASLGARESYGGFLYWETGQGVFAVPPRNMENFAARCGSSFDKSRCQRVNTLRTVDADLRFNTRLVSLHNTLNYAIHRACLRMVLLTDVHRNLTSL